MDAFQPEIVSSVIFLPVVDAWLELSNHISVDEISNPLDFFKERDMVMRWVVLDCMWCP